MAASIAAFCARYAAPGLAWGITGPSVIASAVMVEIVAEEVERAFETVAQRDCRSPAQRLADQRVVGIVVADVDPFAVGGEFALLEVAGAVESDEQPRQVDE